MIINDYLKASRGEYEICSSGFASKIQHSYDLVLSAFGMTSDNSQKPKLIITDSRLKSAEYISVGTEHYIIFDEPLAWELFVWSAIFYGEFNDEDCLREFMNTFGTRTIAEEYYLQGNLEAALAIGINGSSIIDSCDLSLKKNNDDIENDFTIGLCFILAHELVHWSISSGIKVPDATIYLRKIALESLKYHFSKKNFNFIKEKWLERYENSEKDTLWTQLFQHIGNNLLDEELKKNSAIQRDLIEENSKIDEEDLLCDLVAYLAVKNSLRKSINNQLVTSGIFLTFRHLRVIAHLKDCAYSKSQTVSFGVVRQLQTRHFALRDVWRMSRVDDYDDSILANMSDKHDDRIDMYTLMAFPMATDAMRLDKELINDNANAVKDLNELSIKNIIEVMLDKPFEQL